jgi:hypothetical protein
MAIKSNFRAAGMPFAKDIRAVEEFYRAKNG